MSLALDCPVLLEEDTFSCYVGGRTAEEKAYLMTKEGTDVMSTLVKARGKGSEKRYQ